MNDTSPLMPLPADPVHTQGTPEPRTVEIARVLCWLRQAWEGFTLQPGLWLLMTLALLALTVGVISIPLLGLLTVVLLLPVLVLGMIYAAKRQNEGTGLFELSDLFVGFRQNTRNLITFSLWLLVLIFCILVLDLAFVGGNLLFAFLFGSSGQPVIAVGLGLSALILAGAFNVVLMFLLFMATYFALPLIFFHNLPPLRAMQLSWRASRKNWPSMVILSLMSYAASFFAALPLGLGFLILMPIFVGVLYAAYQDIFCG